MAGPRFLDWLSPLPTMTFVSFPDTGHFLSMLCCLPSLCHFSCPLFNKSVFMDHYPWIFPTPRDSVLLVECRIPIHWHHFWYYTNQTILWFFFISLSCSWFLPPEVRDNFPFYCIFSTPNTGLCLEYISFPRCSDCRTRQAKNQNLYMSL